MLSLRKLEILEAYLHSVSDQQKVKKTLKLKTDFY